MKGDVGKVTFLSCDLKAGDVILTRSPTTESTAIRFASNPPRYATGWSHAALVIDPTIWFEASGRGPAGFGLRRPQALLAHNGAYAVQFEELCDEILILRSSGVKNWDETFWRAAAPWSGLSYPSRAVWAKDWIRAWMTAITNPSRSRPPSRETVFCSQLVYLTLGMMGTFRVPYRLREFISPTMLRTVLLRNGYREIPHPPEAGHRGEVLADRVSRSALDELSFRSTVLSNQLNDLMRRSAIHSATWRRFGGSPVDEPIPESSLPKSDKDYQRLRQDLLTWWSKLAAHSVDKPLYDVAMYPKFYFTQNPDDYDLNKDLIMPSSVLETLRKRKGA